MTRIAIPAALAVALALAGCSALSPYAGVDATLNAAAAKVGADVAAADAAVAKLSNGKLQDVLNRIAVAQGYFDTVAATGLLPASALHAEQVASAAVTALRAHPPQNVGQALEQAAAAWAVIQAATTVPK